MNPRFLVAGITLSIGAIGLAGCSSTTSSSTSTTTASSTTAPATTTTSIPKNGAVNLDINPAVSSQLLATGAALLGAPVSQYSGLATGLTYYAYDNGTKTYYASARLVPSPVPTGAQPSEAQISSQDDGSYLLYQMPLGGAWTAYRDGSSGPNTPCPTGITLPSDVVTLWGWPAGSCRPSGV